MLAMSDTNIEQFFPIFASTGVPVAFLVPTPTGFNKSIMDATGPVRELLKDSNTHIQIHTIITIKNKVLKQKCL